MLEAPETRIGQKMDSTFAPFAELLEHVFGHKGDMRSAADLLELFGVGARNNQCEVGGAVGRSDYDPRLPRLARLLAPVKNDLEAEQVLVEDQAAVKIPHVDHHRLQAQERILAPYGTVCAFW